ncbi:MAG: hypothetical protein ACXWDM_10505, partial [Nocardioides sp.]
VSGVSMFLQAESKRALHASGAAAWDILRDDVAQVYLTRPDGKSFERLWRQCAETLQARARALRENQPDPRTPPPSDWTSISTE